MIDDSLGEVTVEGRESINHQSEVGNPAICWLILIDMHFNYK